MKALVLLEATRWLEYAQLRLAHPVSSTSWNSSQAGCDKDKANPPEEGKSLCIGSNLSDNVSRYQSANTTRSDSIATCPPTISLRRILPRTERLRIAAVKLQSCYS